MSDLITIRPADDELPPATSAYLRRIADPLFSLIPGLRGTSVTNRLMVAVHGSIWTFVGYGSSQLLKLVTTLVLANLILDPRAFGLMALVNVFLTGLEVLSDLGIGLDIVQHPRGEDPSFLDTAFMFQMMRSVLLCLIAMGLAVPFAAFYHQPEVQWLAIVGSLSIGIRGFASMSVWLMTRRVQLGKLTGVNVISDAVGLIASVLWVRFSPTAWALVAGKIATTVAFVIASHFFSERLPRLRYERHAAREILMFGSGIFLASATYFLSSESERLVVGKFTSAAELGCFALALSMSYAPFGVVQRIISNVFFPMISNTVREDKERAAKHFRKFRVVFLVASLMMAIGFITLSHSVVRFVLPPQYASTAWMLQLLGFRSALELFGSAASAMLLAAGITRYAAIGNTAKLCFLVIGLTIAFGRFGLRQAMWILALSPVVYYGVMLWGIKKSIGIVLPAEVTCLVSFLGTTALVLLIYLAAVSR